jgi:hypothetical protein
MSEAEFITDFKALMEKHKITIWHINSYDGEDSIFTFEGPNWSIDLNDMIDAAE